MRAPFRQIHWAQRPKKDVFARLNSVSTIQRTNGVSISFICCAITALQASPLRLALVAMESLQELEREVGRLASRAAQIESAVKGNSGGGRSKQEDSSASGEAGARAMRPHSVPDWLSSVSDLNGRRRMPREGRLPPRGNQAMDIAGAPDKYAPASSAAGDSSQPGPPRARRPHAAISRHSDAVAAPSGESTWLELCGGIAVGLAQGHGVPCTVRAGATSNASKRGPRRRRRRPRVHDASMFVVHTGCTARNGSSMPCCCCSCSPKAPKRPVSLEESWENLAFFSRVRTPQLWHLCGPPRWERV